MEERLIETADALLSVLKEAQGADRVAVDLEGDGMFRYRARMCTMQLAYGDKLVVVDTLAIDDLPLEALSDLLSARGPLKIIHDVSFDARLLRRNGLSLNHVFDTALAARYLGEQSTGLSALLSHYCGQTLSKELQQHDWGERPLPRPMLRYLYQDVAHLFQLHDHLSARVESQGIGAELTEEVAYTLRQACAEPSRADRAPWLRVKGAVHATPVEQAVLRELCAMREALAQERDLPPFRILHDRQLVALAQSRPCEPSALRRGPARLPTGALDLSTPVLQSIARGVAAGAPPADELAYFQAGPPASERGLRRRVEKALSTFRRQAAEVRGVDVQVVLPGHCLSELAAKRPTTADQLPAIDGLGQARIDRYGAELLLAVGSVGADGHQSP